MTDNSLLPQLLAAEKHFQALAAQTARLQQIDLTPLLVYLLDMTEASALPWLEEQLALTGVNGWHLAESDDGRRAILKSAITLHRYIAMRAPLVDSRHDTGTGVWGGDDNRRGGAAQNLNRQPRISIARRTGRCIGLPSPN